MKKILVLLFIVGLTLTLSAQEKVKYVFLFVGDGFGVLPRHITELIDGNQLILNGLPVKTLTGTRNVFGAITDSAASGTAIACGVKTYNSAIAMDQNKKPLVSIAKKLQKEGFKIGIVSSSHLTDATLAAQYANQVSRTMFDEIGKDMAASGFHFFGGAAVKGKETEEHLKKAGYTILTKEDTSEEGRTRDKVYLKSQPYTPWTPNEVKPKDAYSLADYTRIMTERFQNHPNGFFFLIENGMTDYAGHANDLGWQYREIHALDQAVKVALDFQKKYPAETLVIVTADHETGGLELLGLMDKDKLSAILAQQKKIDDMAADLDALFLTGTPQDKIIETAAFLLNKDGKLIFTQEEHAQLVKAINSMKGKPAGQKLIRAAIKMRDKRLGVVYSTGGHSGKQVCTYVKGPGEEFFCSPLENCDLPQLIEMIVLSKKGPYADQREKLVLENAALAPYRENADPCDRMDAKIVPDGVLTTKIASKTFTMDTPWTSELRTSCQKGKDVLIVDCANDSIERPYLVRFKFNDLPKDKSYLIFKPYQKVCYVPGDGTGSDRWTAGQLKDSFRLMLAPGERSTLVIGEKLPVRQSGPETKLSQKSILDAYHASKIVPMQKWEVPVLKGDADTKGNTEDALWSLITYRALPFGINKRSAAQDIIYRAAVNQKRTDLLIQMELRDDQLKAKATTRDSAVYDDDCVEFFFGSKGEKVYYHFIVNSNGAVYDAKKGDVKWNLEGYTVQTKRTERGWQLQLKLPLNAFNFKGFPMINICVIDKPGGGISTLAPTAGYFHDPKDFIPICID